MDKFSEESIEALAKKASFNAMVNFMTNHERNQWARAGYPGLRTKKCAELLKFIPEDRVRKKLSD